jgi:hypothetical protein
VIKTFFDIFYLVVLKAGFKSLMVGLRVKVSTNVLPVVQSTRDAKGRIQTLDHRIASQGFNHCANRGTIIVLKTFFGIFYLAMPKAGLKPLIIGLRVKDSTTVLPGVQL